MSEINRNKRKEIIQNNTIDIDPDYLENNSKLQKDFSFAETFLKNTFKSNFKQKNSLYSQNKKKLKKIWKKYSNIKIRPNKKYI